MTEKSNRLILISDNFQKTIFGNLSLKLPFLEPPKNFDESCGEFGSCGAATCREHEGGSKTCVCENRQFFDSSTKTCVSSCAEGSIYVSKIDTCFKIADLNTKKYQGQGLLSKPWDEAVSHCEEQEKVRN